MKTLNSFLSANHASEVILNLNQISALKGGDANSSSGGATDHSEIIEKDPPIYIKE